MSTSNVTYLAKMVPPDTLSEDAQALMLYVAAPRHRKATRDSIVEQFNETFQLIGGVPRLALWADKNPTAFYSLYSKLIPAAIKAELTLPPQVDGMTQDQIKELSAEQLKMMVLLHTSTNSVVDVEFTEASAKPNAA
jgi:hypothetical protein